MSARDLLLAAAGGAALPTVTYGDWDGDIAYISAALAVVFGGGASGSVSSASISGGGTFQGLDISGSTKALFTTGAGTGTKTLTLDGTAHTFTFNSTSSGFDYFTNADTIPGSVGDTQVWWITG